MPYFYTHYVFLINLVTQNNAHYNKWNFIYLTVDVLKLHLAASDTYGIDYFWGICTTHPEAVRKWITIYIELLTEEKIKYLTKGANSQIHTL